MLIVLAWLLSQVVKLALSRSRELLADAGSVELTKNPDAMISALRKIENRGELPGATSAVMELCIDNPREGFADLFATHPSVRFPGAGAGEISPAATIPGGWRCRRNRGASRTTTQPEQPKPAGQPPPPVPRGPGAMPPQPAEPRPARPAAPSDRPGVNDR